MIISTFTVMEFSIALGGILGALAGVIRASGCQKVKCLWGGLECDKTVVPPVEPVVIDDIELKELPNRSAELPHTTRTTDPRPPSHST